MKSPAKPIAAMAAAAILATTAVAELRTFTSRAGSTIQGELVAVSGDSVTIKSADGRAITTKTANLIAADVAYVKAHALNQAAPIGASLSATKDAPFINSLGMKFVPVPKANVLVCIHETRKGDYAAFAAETTGLEMSWKNVRIEGAANAAIGTQVSSGDDHPVVRVSWIDATAFCVWLNKKEGRNYRLPTDREWTCAVGLADKEAAFASSPASLDSKIKKLYPWGTQWPPQGAVGNLSDRSSIRSKPGNAEMLKYIIEGYDDGAETTATVMNYPANDFGIYDLAGNVAEMCEDWFDTKQKERVIRGSSWQINEEKHCLSSFRWKAPPTMRHENTGFRVVLELPKP